MGKTHKSILLNYNDDAFEKPCDSMIEASPLSNLHWHEKIIFPHHHHLTLVVIVYLFWSSTDWIIKLTKIQAMLKQIIYISD